MGQSGTIVVKVDGITDNKGNVGMVLYNKAAVLSTCSKQSDGTPIKAPKYGVTYTSKSIPVGIYALAVFHDKSEDKQINNNWFGIPSQDYGFSFNKSWKFLISPI